MKLFYSAMLCFFVGLLFVPIGVSFAQNSDKQAIIDSLTNELSKAKEDTNKVKLLNVLVFHNYRVDIEKMGVYAGEAISLAQKINFKKGLMQGYNGMGIYSDLKGEKEKAISYYNKELEVAEEIKDTRAKSRVRNNFANIYMNQGNYDKALEYHLLNLKENTTENLSKARTYQNIGNCYAEKAEYSKSVDSYLNSLKIYEKLNDKDGQQAVLNNIGTVYEKLKQYDKAIEYYKKSYQIAESQKNRVGMAINMLNIAIAYQEKKEFKKASIYAYKALESFEKASDIQGEAGCHQIIAATSLAQKNYKQAIFHQEKTMELYKKLNDKFLLAGAYSNLGEVYIETEEYDKALQAYLLGLDIAQKADMKESVLNIKKGLSKLYEKKKDLPSALNTMKESEKLNDSIFSSTTTKQINELNIKYETAQKEAQLKISEQEKQLAQAAADRNFWSLVVASFFLLVAIGFALLFSKNNALNKKLKEVASHRTVNDFKGLFGNLKDDNGQVLPQYQDVAGKLLAIATTQERLAKSTKADDYISITEEIPDFMQNVKDVMGAKKLLIQTDIGKFALRLNKSNALLYLIDELVRNAIKHAFANTTQPEVNLSLHQENGALHLIFKDNGSGISEGKKPAIIHELVENFNGTVKITNGGGTVYDMVLRANLKQQ